MTATATEEVETVWGSEIVRRTNHPPFLTYEPRPHSMLTLLGESLRWNDRDAFVHAGQRVTYAELAHRIASGAATLDMVSPGDRVLILGANSIGWVVAFWSILRSGGIVVLGNGWWSQREVEHALAQTAPVAAIVDERCRDHIPPTLRAIRAEELGMTQAGPVAPQPCTAEDDAAVIQFTSGSTGAPKGAVLSHRSIIANQHMLLSVSRRLPHQITLDAPAEVSLQTGPLFHIGGVQALIRSMLTGGTMVFLRRKFDAAEVLELIDTERITRWGGAPTMVSRVLAHPDMGTRNLSTLTHITLGGAPSSTELGAEIQRRFPSARRGLSQVYGMSEAGGTLCAASGRDSADRPGVTGRPLPLVELRIDNADPDGVGEVVVRTPTQMSGYWREHDGVIQTDDGWLRTGDLGRLDSGYLYVTGRSKDVVIRGGENIAAAHVESVVLQHPAVQEVAVVGLPDHDLGQVVGAAVRIRRGATTSVGELTEFAARSLAYFEVPLHWRLSEEALPVNATGKLDKKAIQANWSLR